MSLYKNKYRIEPARLTGFDYGSNAAYFITICTKHRFNYFGNIVETHDYASQSNKMDNYLPNVKPHDYVAQKKEMDNYLPNVKPHDYVAQKKEMDNLNNNEKDNMKGNETDNYPSLQATMIAKIAEKFWNEIPQHYPFVLLDEFIIMPNHIHGIIILNKNGVETHDYASLDNVSHDYATLDNVSHDFATLENVSLDNVSHDYASLENGSHDNNTNNRPPQQQWQENKFGVQSKNIPAIIRGFKSSVKRFANINNIEFEWQSRYYDRIIRNEAEFNNIRNYIFNNPINWAEDENYSP